MSVRLLNFNHGVGVGDGGDGVKVLYFVDRYSAGSSKCAKIRLSKIYGKNHLNLSKIDLHLKT